MAASVQDLYEIEYYCSDDPDNDEEQTANQHGLAMRSNEIYRQQLKYMQDHLQSLRSLIMDKENIIENLMLRFQVEKVAKDASATSIVSGDEMKDYNLRMKAEALAQRTILENFALKEIVQELRDENTQLRHTIYYLQDQMNGKQPNELAKVRQTPNPQQEQTSTDNSSAGYLSQRIEALQQEITQKDKELETLRERIRISPLVRAMEPLTQEQKTQLLDGDAEDEQQLFPAIDVEVDSVHSALHLVQSKHNDLQKEYKKLTEEVADLRKLKVNVNHIRKLFGCSIKSLIPYQLSDKSLSKYSVLFDGYCRETCAVYTNQQSRIIPAEVIKLISFYYPIFWALSSPTVF